VYSGYKNVEINKTDIYKNIAVFHAFKIIKVTNRPISSYCVSGYRPRIISVVMRDATTVHKSFNSIGTRIKLG
jgi:hypothetical protein